MSSPVSAMLSNFRKRYLNCSPPQPEQQSLLSRTESQVCRALTSLHPHSSSASKDDASDTDHLDQINDAVAQRHRATAMAETVYVAGCSCPFCIRHSVCTVSLAIVFLLTLSQRKLMTMQISDVPPRGPVRGALITVRCRQLAASCKYYTHRRIWVSLAPFLTPHRTPRATLPLSLLGMTQRFPH